MRMLFNHGLIGEELFTNTPKNVVDRNKKWFTDRYGISDSLWDSIAMPFEYCFSLVIRRVLEDRVRFKLPNVRNGYIDYEVVTDDLFYEHRMNGRFQNIDFTESDFTGYALRIHIDTPHYQKTYPIYLGGELKQSFLDGINSGINYYTIKDITVNEFINQVHERFNELTKKEIKKILVLGWRRLASALSFGCAITINIRKEPSCYAYIGRIYTNPEWQIKMYISRMKRKKRIINIWQKKPYDGFYYLSLNPDYFKLWQELNKGCHKRCRFPAVILNKNFSEVIYNHSHVYIFKVPIKKYTKWQIYKEKGFISRDVQYLGEAINYKFIPTRTTWQKLVKYETIDT